jgi:excisionase family DNA binding protein
MTSRTQSLHTPQHPQPSSGLVTLSGAQNYLSLSRASVYRLIAEGRLRTVKIGAAHRVPIEALEEFVASLPSGGAA